MNIRLGAFTDLIRLPTLYVDPTTGQPSRGPTAIPQMKYYEAKAKAEEAARQHERDVYNAAEAGKAEAQRAAWEAEIAAANAAGAKDYAYSQWQVESDAKPASPSLLPLAAAAAALFFVWKG